MGFARTYTVTLRGLEGHLIEVEADIAQNLPAFVLLGLPDTALKESRERIRSAASNSGLPLAARKITVSLTPATLPKTGTSYDLAIVMAAIQAAGKASHTGNVVFLAELGLDGSLRPVPGVFPAVAAAVEAGFVEVVVAAENRTEAELVPGARVHGLEDLASVLSWSGAECRSLRRPAARSVIQEVQAEAERIPDLSEVAGQHEGKWALEVAAAGGHHLSMIGPPGSGKTMLAERLPGILPALSLKGSHEVTAVHSLSHHRTQLTGLIERPPWEAPHHSASSAAIIGGGSGIPQPGAVSRAHQGVLFLDEAPEFRRGVLDSLRQPLESGQITISRSRYAAKYPARFQLVLASNPCPCGLALSLNSRCTCTYREKRSYFGRLSGPLMDRIDLHLSIPKLSWAEMTGSEQGESSDVVAQRVVAARQAAAERLGRWNLRVNAELTGSLLRHELALDRRLLTSLHRLMDRGDLTARGCDRIQRVAWSIADLEGAVAPAREHLDAAVALRVNSALLAA